MFSVYIRDVLFKNLFIVVCCKFKLASSIYSSIHINIRNNKSNLLSLWIEVFFNNNKNIKKTFQDGKGLVHNSTYHSCVGSIQNFLIRTVIVYTLFFIGGRFLKLWLQISKISYYDQHNWKDQR